MEKENPSYYAVIPADVRYDKHLKPMEKIIYSEITALCNMNGKCTASNNYFSNLYEVSKETVSRWFSNLKKHGYISISFTYNEDKSIDKRVVQVADSKINTPLQNNHEGDDEKINTPHDKKVKENINTTYVNNINTTYSNNKPVFIFDNWRKDFDVYKKYTEHGFRESMNDKDFVSDLGSIFDTVDISATVREAYKTYWLTEDGWKQKKKKRTKKIDFKETIRNILRMGYNNVYKGKPQYKQQSIFDSSSEFRPEGRVLNGRR